jgi:hypothetical protein
LAIANIFFDIKTECLKFACVKEFYYLYVVQIYTKYHKLKYLASANLKYREQVIQSLLAGLLL